MNLFTEEIKKLEEIAPVHVVVARNIKNAA